MNEWSIDQIHEYMSNSLNEWMNEYKIKLNNWLTDCLTKENRIWSYFAWTKRVYAYALFAWTDWIKRYDAISGF